MIANNEKSKNEKNRYTVIGETGSVYLRVENRYPEKGEVIKLSTERAQVLLSSKLIAPFIDAQESIIKE